MCYGGLTVNRSFTAIFSVVLILVQGILSIDICSKGTSTQDLTSALHPGALPKGGFQAGNFSKDLSATKLSKCILSCCSQDSCDAVFFFHNPKSDSDTCYLIQCNRTYPGSCDAGDPASTTNKTYFVNVRNVEYSPSGSAPVVPEGSCNILGLDTGCRDNEECRVRPTTSSFITECVCVKGYTYDVDRDICVEEKKTPTICDPEKDECDRNEECYVPALLSSSMGICVCRKGYEKNQKGVCESVIPKHSSSSSHHHFKPRQCEYGLRYQCDEYQECYIPRHSHSRIGICRCIEGYQFNEYSQCVLIANETSSPETSTVLPAIHHKKQCEYGIIDQCDEYEECFIPADSHSRIGVCVCLHGYQRDVNYTCVNVSIGDLDLSASKRNKSLTPSTTTTTTTTTATTTTERIVQLTVSAGENKVIQLPENEVTLNAYVISKEDKDSKFDYEWVLLSMPDGKEIGNMVGKNSDKLQLSKLIEGLYTFKIHVTGPHQEGEAFVNVTVLPPARKNTPPVAVIKPVNQVVKLPNSAILDGSDSTDDDKIVKYQWAEKSGPIQEHQLEDDTAMLTLKGLAPGSYLFELTVTDSDGASNSTVANVTVIQETDYPPKANAGSDVVIRLPQNSVVLNGNLSTDDKGIQEYEWIKSVDDKLTADMTGVRTPYLHLSNLQEGDYMFTLKVTDTAGQTSSADVHVFVKPDTNHPPVAQVTGPKTLFLPVDSIVLNGSNSTDDKGIVEYSWEQIRGNKLDIKDPKAAVTIATGAISNRVYEFVLTVRDVEHISSTVSYIVTIDERPNTKPVANAGQDQVLTLPVDLVKLDGSKSSDDKGIASYSWTREPTSLAAGDPLNGSDHQAVLQLVNMVAGQYTFRLTVVDAEGLSASDTASVHIVEDPHEKDMIELDIETDIRQFTEKDKSNLQSQLQLLLPIGDKSNVVIDRLEEDTQSSLMKVFLHVEYPKDSMSNKSGEEIAQLLKAKMRTAGYQLLSYNVATLDTVVCQNNCSGHGHCLKKTRKCICDAFWMENFFKTLILHDDSNCDWSILYFIIVTFLIMVVLAAIVWGCICWFKNKRCRFRWRTKKRHRYSLLQDTEYKDEIKLLPKGKTQNSSMMISESDFSSDEETLFVNHKKNGFIKKPPNGINKQHLKNKLKA